MSGVMAQKAVASRHSAEWPRHPYVARPDRILGKLTYAVRPD